APHPRGRHLRARAAGGGLQGRRRALGPHRPEPQDRPGPARAGGDGMSVFASLRTALRALRKTKLRSFLAALGIVIAVAAVIATVAIGEGAKAKVADQMASLGSNLLMILPGSVMQHGAATGAGATQNLTRDDAATIEKGLTGPVAAVARINRTGGKVIYGDANWFTQVVGTTPGYLAVRGWRLAEGEAFGREEDAAAAKVCLIGQAVKDELFGDWPGAGEQMRVKHVPWRVVGA